MQIPTLNVMYNNMTEPTYSYTVNGITIREAHPEEWPQIFCVSEIASQQKHDNLTAPPLNKLYRDYEEWGEDLIIDDWRKSSARFLIATVPPENVSITIPDRDGQAIVGFCGIRINDKTDNPTCIMDRLYAIRSNHAVGSALMGHCIRTAQENNAESIKLQAPFAQSHKWYKEKALFEQIGEKRANLMLYRENFDQSLESLQQPALAFSSKSPTI